MSEPKAFADGVQFGWDSTSIKLATECPRKYQYTMIEGWQYPDKSVHLLFGGWYASALENFHKYRASGYDYEAALRTVVYEALVATWIDGAPWVPTFTSKTNTKTRESLIRTIVWYLEHFKDDNAKTIILADGKAATEYSFAIPVDDGIVFSGHLDRFVEYMGRPYVQDQKTTASTITARFFEGYNPDIQMSMYTFAGQMLYKTPVAGVMIDAAQIAVGFSRFERGFTFRTTGQLDEWYDETLATIERTRRYTRENHFPMNTTACGNFAGCQYRRVCSRSPEVREQFLKADFVKGERWDPLKAR